MAFLLVMFYVLTDFSAKATEEYELARQKVANFINASESREIVFTRNATEAINLVAYSWGLANLSPEDEVSSWNIFFFSNLPNTISDLILKFPPLTFCDDQCYR